MNSLEKQDESLFLMSLTTLLHKNEKEQLQIYCNFFPLTFTKTVEDEIG